jgi:23S rRNA (adenine2503-C2)-methyltransferase
MLGDPKTPTREQLLDLDLPRLAEFFETISEEPYRAGQVLEWVYRHGATSFEEMTSLSKELRERLQERFEVYASRVDRQSVSADGTIKLLLRWPDRAASECVLIPEETRRTACVSSQVGCPVGCRFCASGLGGLERNLTTGQIVEQVLRISGLAQAAGAKLSHVVFMGLGEPLANYDAVVRAVRTLNAPWGLNIGARKITISTVGLPKQIRRLAEEGLQLNLALSLHAPTDELRVQLIPWARQIPIADLREACEYYFEKTGREITLEYVLLRGVNDGRTHAQQLARFAGRFRCNVNLIRYNAVEGLPFARPASEATRAFQESLRQYGVNAHIRTSRGLDIEAACGQLRRVQMQEVQDQDSALPARQAEPLS